MRQELAVMSSNEVAVDPRRQQMLSVMPTGQLDIVSMGKVLSESGYFRDIKSMAQGIVKIMLGQELGLGPLMSIMKLYIVKENPVISANLMASRIRQSGFYDYEVLELDQTHCSIRFSRKAGGAWKVLTPDIAFTVEDARRARLGGSKNDGPFDSDSNWAKWPRNMVFARAMSDGYRVHCPDVFSMPVYNPGDFEVEVDQSGEIVREAVVVPEPNRPASEVVLETPQQQPSNGNGNGKSTSTVNPINEAQIRRLFAIQKGRVEAGWTDEHTKQLLTDHGIASSREIPRNFYDAICRTIEKQTWDEYTASKTEGKA